MTDKLLTPKQVSEILSISIKTVYEWAVTEKIPSVKLFGELRFRESEINDIIKNGLQKPERKINIQKPKPKIKSTQQKRIPYWDLKPEKLQG